MDKNDKSMKKMLIGSLGIGVLVFAIVFIVAFKAFTGDSFKGVNKKVDDKKVNVNDLTQKEMTTAIYQINHETGDVKLYSYLKEEKDENSYKINNATRFLDKDSKLINSERIMPGCIVDIVYTESSGIISQMKLNSKGFEKTEIINYDLAYGKGTITVDNKKYNLDNNLVMTNGDKTAKYTEFTSKVAISIRGFDKIVLGMNIDYKLGNIKLVYDKSLASSNVAIGNDKIVKIEEVEDVYLKPGEYNLVITKTGVDEISRKVMVEEGVTTPCDLGKILVKNGIVEINSNLSGFTMSVKSTDGSYNKTYTDTNDTSNKLKLMDGALELPYGVYIMTFSKDGYKTVTRKVTLDSEEKTVNVAFLNSNGEVATETKNTYKVVIESEPTGASIYVNGKLEGLSKVTVYLKEGENEVKVALSGYQAVERTLNITENKEYKFVLSNANVYETTSDEGSVVTNDIYQKK